jgi:hypothetical protein
MVRKNYHKAEIHHKADTSKYRIYTDILGYTGPRRSAWRPAAR